jgi:hypothetical protein
VDCDTVPIP